MSFRTFVKAIERRGYSPWTAAAAALWIAGIRNVEEYLLIFLPKGLPRNLTEWLGHVQLFYLALIYCISAWLATVLKRPADKVVPAVAAGLVLGIMPPLIDMWIYAPGEFGYGYRLGASNIPWLFYDPPHITPLGETVTVWGSMVLMLVYARAVGATALQTLVVGIGHYGLILLFLAGLPHIAMAASASADRLRPANATSILLALSAFTGFLVLRRPLLWRLLKRMPHALLAPSLVLVGGGLSGTINGATGTAAVILGLAASVFTLHNDYYDRREDAAQGRASVMTHDDVIALTLIPIGLWVALSPAAIWPVIGAMLFAVVGFAYHGDPHRLKCVFPLSYKSETFFALICLFSGFLANKPQAIEAQAIVMALLVAGGASIIAVLKDFKDIDADAQAGVRTLFVVLESRGYHRGRIMLVTRAVAALCFFVPAGWFAHIGDNDSALTLAAINAGIILLPAVVRKASWAFAGILCLVNVYLVVAAFGLQRAPI